MYVTYADVYTVENKGAAEVMRGYDNGDKSQFVTVNAHAQVQLAFCCTFAHPITGLGVGQETIPLHVIVYQAKFVAVPVAVQQ